MRRIKEGQANRTILLGVSGNSIPQANVNAIITAVPAAQLATSLDQARENG